ncbi:MAG: hypothetical protein ACRELY_14185, partial [Polyangiaceae bacterium]
VLGFLYPYDKTVWPRGLLAPLLQWESNLSGISAVYIHLTETNFEFEGYYLVSGASQFHQPIDETAWTKATDSNGGDPLHVEVKVMSTAGVTGPITEDWTIAPGILQGTVYYNSYRTQLAVPVSGETRAAAILKIKPGASDPLIALPGAETQCVVCHVVSDDGSTLFAQYGIEPGDNYARGDSYDMTDGGAHIQTYTGTAGDGTTNNRKFLWSAPWKDGTFQFQSVGNTQEAYGGPENVYRRDNGNAVPTSGLGGVAQAVTPAFSRDGKSVAFDGWTMQSDAGLASGNGHTLDVMDFACGAGGDDAGGPSCGSFDFSNLRRIYTNSDATNGYVGWPAWTPDSNAVIFHNVVTKPTAGSKLATWFSAQAQLWYTNVPPASGVYPDGGAAPAASPIRLNALNGLDSAGISYLPAPADVTGSNANHANDAVYNYEPTINPIASGGYYWVVFTSRRMYGNIAVLDAFDTGNGSDPVAKKLLVAAIDINPAPGADASHPAFYLPGQEINAGNMRGFWVVDPCRANGSSCDTGDECCNGFCRAPDDGGAGLVCGDKPPGCVQEFEKCTTTADCCGAGSLTCINGTCSKPGPR